MLGKDGAHLGHAIEEVFAALENLAEGKGDGAGLDAGRSYLIDERGKLVIVVAVDEHHLEIGVTQLVGQAKASETASDDDHSLFIAFG